MEVTAFAIQLGFSLVTYILNTVLKKYGGDTSIGAMAIVQSFMTFMAMPIFGINQGIQPILGYNYGAEKYKRVKEALYKGIFAATIICIIGYTSVRLFSSSLIKIFTTNLELEEITRYGLKAYTLVFPIVGFQIVSSIYFQAVGKPKNELFYKSFKANYRYDTLFNNFANIFWAEWYLVCSTDSR